MHYKTLLIDCRHNRGVIWNLREILKDCPFGPLHAPWNRGEAASSDSWVDEFVYQGFVAYGKKFLQALRGRFAVAWVDGERGQMFMARDWIGEQPFHCIATLDGIAVSNNITDLQSATGLDYSYSYVRAFPQAHYQIIDLKEVRAGAVSSTIRPSPPVLYYDFGRAVEQVRQDFAEAAFAGTCELMRDRLDTAVRERVAAHAGRPIYLLLSGGLDSFSVALALKRAEVKFEAVTLAVKGGGGDIAVARQFAKRLGLRHHALTTEPAEIVNAFEGAIRISECYHIFNVYCAVGMHVLGTKMKAAGMEVAFCGEAVNEAVGDYHDWVINDPATRRPVMLQKINSARLERVEERLVYVWGKSVDAGLYNKQLGTGLAKHAGARMFKPFQHHGLHLEAPYYERALLQQMISIPPDTLNKIGGKPGLFLRIFERDLKRFEIPKELVLNCKKVRFQDATEGAEGGITSVLHQKGLNQKRALVIFNRLFAAHLDPALEGRRLVCTAAA